MNRLILHPILFALYPAVSLAALNRELFEPGVALVPSLVIVAGTGILWTILRLLQGDWMRAGISTTLLLACIFTYGAIHQELVDAGKPVAGRSVELHPALLPIWCGLFALAVWGTTRKRSRIQLSNRIMNVATSLLLVMPAGMMVTFQLQRPPPPLQEAEIQLAGLDTPPSRPNIFYIVLDGYGREDVLLDLYGHDNQPFLNALRQRGFYLPPKSHANYCQTVLSLTATLNLDYLALDNGSAPANVARIRLIKRLRKNILFDFLRRHGYSITAVASGCSFTTLDDVDLYLSPRVSLHEFHHVLINHTVLPAVLSLFDRTPGHSQHAYHADLIDFSFQQLENTGNHRQPFFLLAHMILPHPPFVFGADGERTYPDLPFTIGDGNQYLENGGTSEEYREGYVHKVAYANQKLLHAIDTILASSSRPPIIILQADHGPGLRLDWESAERTDHRERMSIFSAYHLPGVPDEDIPENISSVNTFRLLLNAYWQADLPLLENRAYFSKWYQPTSLIDITDALSPSPAVE